MSNKQTKLLFEGWRRFLNEDADPTKIPDEKFPIALSAVDKEKAKEIATSGLKDGGEQKDDVVKVEKGKPFACSDLSPSQTTMDINKAWQFALSMMNGTMPGSKGPGGNLNAFISSDKYIMDGHHRWIATAMVDPSAELQGNLVNLPGAKLVAVLNTITKGILNVDQGKPGTGGFEQFKDKNALKAALEKQISGQMGKLQGPIGGDPKQIKNILSKWCGESDPNKVVDVAVEKVFANVGPIASRPVMPSAPDRKDMPVVDDDLTPEATKKTIDALTQGMVDMNPPFAKDTQPAQQQAMKEALLNKKIRKIVLEEIRKLK